MKHVLVMSNHFIDLSLHWATSVPGQPRYYLTPPG